MNWKKRLPNYRSRSDLTKSNLSKNGTQAELTDRENTLWAEIES